MPSITGLTAAEVEARRAAGQTNQPPKSQTKTTGEIVRDNVCTYFNLVFLVLAVMLAFVHSWLNMGFLGIVFWNTLIGIVQQLRAKRTIDKLTLVSAQKLRCLRDGRWCEVLSDDLVQDDVVEFGAGDQIAADAVVLDGSAQANESLITGEARAIPKECGAELKSGGRRRGRHGGQSSMRLITPCRPTSSEMTANRPTCWCWRGQDRARRACLCTASPISSA